VNDGDVVSKAPVSLELKTGVFASRGRVDRVPRAGFPGDKRLRKWSSEVFGRSTISKQNAVKAWPEAAEGHIYAN
jgi:hypothetical protein